MPELFEQGFLLQEQVARWLRPADDQNSKDVTCRGGQSSKFHNILQSRIDQTTRQAFSASSSPSITPHTAPLMPSARIKPPLVPLFVHSLGVLLNMAQASQQASTTEQSKAQPASNARWPTHAAAL
eukprot:1182805-Amphidinium_carterae.1